MSLSWKGKGGIDNPNFFKNLNVNTLVCSNFSLNGQYVGTFNVSGGLAVSANAIINNLSISNGLRVTGNTQLGNLVATNANLSNNLTVVGNTVLYQPLYLVGVNGQGINSSGLGNMYLIGDKTGIGINTINPQATLDIYGARPQLISVFADVSSTRNILARNQNNYGITLSADNSGSYIDFYSSDLSINSTTDRGISNGRIAYNPMGIISLDVSSVQSMGPLTIRPFEHGANTNNNFFLQPSTTGNAINIVGEDASSISFLAFQNNSSSTGWLIGGGGYPTDTTRSLKTSGYMSNGGQYVPIETVVSGNSTVLNRATFGINTYAPTTEKYVMDINGPLRLHHNEITLCRTVPFQIVSMSFSPINPLNGIVVGTKKMADVSGNNYYSAYYTLNGGQSWTESILTFGLSHPGDLTFKALYYNATNILLYSSLSFVIHSADNGQTWTPLSPLPTLPSNYNTLMPSIYATSSAIYFSYLISDSTIYYSQLPPTTYSTITSTISVTASHGYNSLMFLAGSGIETYSITSSPVRQHTYTSAIAYNAIQSISGLVIAAGTNGISYSYNDGATWTDVVLSGNMTSVSIYSVLYAMVVGDAGEIYYTVNGGQSWTIVNQCIIAGMGNDQLIFPTTTTNNYSGVYISDVDTFIFSAVTQLAIDNSSVYGNTNLINCYFPPLLNPNSHSSLLDLSGNMTVDGIINGNSIQSNSSINHLYDNDISSTLNIGGSKTTNVISNVLDASFAIFRNGVFLLSNVSGTSIYMSHDANINGNINMIDPSNSHIHTSYIDDISGVINIGTGLGQKRIVIGSIGDDIIMAGNVTQTNVAELLVSANTFVVNDESVYLAANSGMEIYESGNVSAGYILTTLDRSGYKFKSPASTNVISVDVSNLTITNGSLEQLVSIVPYSGTDGDTPEYTIRNSTIDAANVMLYDHTLSVDPSTNVIPNSIVSLKNISAANLYSQGDISGATLHITGNITGGNVVSATTGSFSSNITAANLYSLGDISGATLHTTGNITGGNVVSAITGSFSANVTAANLYSQGDISGATLHTTGNITGGNVISAITGSFSANVTAANLYSLGDISGATLHISGNITGGNVVLAMTGSFSANVVAANLYSMGDISGATLHTTGNITGGNVVSAITGSFSANVTAANLYSLGDISGATLHTTGNITGGNVVSATTGSFSANVTAANLYSLGDISGATLHTTGNITGGNVVSATTGSFSANVTAANLYSLGDISGATLHTTGNITGGNVVSATTGSFSANVTAANLYSLGDISGASLHVSANITGGNIYSFGDISGATLHISGNISGGNVVSATTGSFSANVTAVNLYSLGDISGATLHTTGNITGGNVVSATTGSFSANVTAANLYSLGDISGATLHTTGNITGGNVVSATTGSFSANVTAANLYSLGDISGASLHVSANITGGNIYSFGDISGTTLHISGNISGGNVVSATTGSFSANVVAANLYSLGDISGATLHTTGNITGGNVVSATTGSFSANVTAANLYSLGDISGTSLHVSANITGGNVYSIGDISGASLHISGNIFGGNIISATTGSYSANVTAANLYSLGDISGATLHTTGNITGGNVVSATTGSFSANVTAANLYSLGDISGATLHISGNITGGNVQTSGDISGATLHISGNITGGNVVSATTGSYSANVTAANLYSLGDISGATLHISGNITGGNVVSATTGTYSANVTAANLYSIGDISGATLHISGNITGGNVVSATTGSYSANVTAANLYSLGDISGASVHTTGNINGGNVVSLFDVSSATVHTTTASITNINNISTITANFVQIGNGLTTYTSSTLPSFIAGYSTTTLIIAQLPDSDATNIGFICVLFNTSGVSGPNLRITTPTSSIRYNNTWPAAATTESNGNLITLAPGQSVRLLSAPTVWMVI